MALLTASLLRRLPLALLPLLPLLWLLLPLPLVLPVRLLLRLPCPATFWTSRSAQVLAILEAMKMENEIVAPQDGTVASVNVNKGDTVNSGDTLVSMN